MVKNMDTFVMGPQFSSYLRNFFCDWFLTHYFMVFEEMTVNISLYRMKMQNQKFMRNMKSLLLRMK